MSIAVIARTALVPLLVQALGCSGAEERARDGAARAALDASSEPATADQAAPPELETEDAAPSEADAGCSGDACAPERATDRLEDGIVGMACDDDAACGDGRCLFSERITGVPFPGGYCTGRCRTDAECGETGYCAPGFRDAIGSCLLRCEDDADCGRDGYRCRVADAIGRCMPGPTPLPEGVVGNACTNDDACGGVAMACKAKLAGVDAPHGYCSQSCSIDADCGPDGACVSGLGTAPLSIGTCFARCTPPGGCRNGYTCNALSALEAARGLCVPQRTDGA